MSFCVADPITHRLVVLCTGEQMTEDELAECLTTLLGRKAKNGESELDTCDLTGTGLAFHTAQKQDCFNSQME